MQTRLILTFYVVFLAQSISELSAQITKSDRTKEHLDKDLGPLHIHVNTTKLPPISHPVRWDDRHAIVKATTLVNFVKALPSLNPVHGEVFGPYDASIPALHFKGNLTFENVTINGINGIRSQNFSMQLSPTRIDFNVSIPNITIEADLDLNTIFDDESPIRDRGHFRVSLLDVTVSAVIGPHSVQLQTNKVYQLETAVIDIDLNDVQLQLDTTYAEEVKIILDEFFKHSEDIIIDNNVLNITLQAINQELAKIPAKKIVNYLLGTAEANLALFDPGTKRSGRKYGK